MICPNSLSSPFSFIPFQPADNHCFVSLVLINIKIILLHLCHCMTLSRAFYPCTGIYMFVPSLSLLVILKTFSNCYFICFHFIVSLKQKLTLLSFDTKSIPESCFPLPIKRDFRLKSSVWSMIMAPFSHGHISITLAFCPILLWQ